MKLMKPSTWNKMTDNEKIEHLKHSEVLVKKKTFMDGNAKVGDIDNAFILKYRAYCGGVIVSPWSPSEKEAEMIAKQSISKAIFNLKKVVKQN